MGAVLPVRVRSKGGHPNRSEPQLREGELDDVDKELQKRGHAFVRYADAAISTS